MRIKSLELRNYGPYGNELIVFDLTDDGMMAQLGGNNGFGKSSFIRAFKTALYGETDGIVLSNIANDINGNCVLKAKIDVKGTNWTIERGFSPNYVKAFLGDKDKPEDYGGIDAVKNKIKKEIIDLPYYIFSSILSLSVDDFKSFLTMKTADAKNIRDRIFGFYVINEIFEKVKNELNAAEKDYDTMNTKLASKQENVAYLHQQLAELKEKVEKQLKEKLTQLKTEFDTKKKEVGEWKLSVAEDKALLEKLKEELVFSNTLLQHNSNIETTKLINETNTELNFLNKKIVELDKTKTEFIKGTGEYEKYLRYLDSETAKLEIPKLEATETELHDKLDRLSLYETGVHTKVRFEKLKEEKEKAIKLRALYEKNNTGLNNAVDTSSKLNQQLNQYKLEFDDINKKITLYESGVCYACGTSFTDDNHKSELETMVSKKTELEQNITKINQKITEITTKVNNGKPIVSKQKSDLDILEHLVSNMVEQLADANEEKIIASVARMKDEGAGDLVEIDLRSELKEVGTKLAALRLKLVDFTFEKEVTKPDETILAEVTRELNTRNEQLGTTNRKLATLEAKLHTIPEGFDPKRKLKYTDHEEKIANIETNTNSIDTNIKLGNARLAAIVEEVNKLKADNGKEQLESMNNMVTSAENELKQMEVDIEKQKSLINYKRAQKHTLSDEGIKSHIIREFVPFINANIQRLLANFQEVNLNLYFDAEFKAHIFRHGKEVALNTTSTGQKKILNFCILITMTKILKLKYPDINLIFYDEIFSSVHPINRTIILDIIEQEIKRDLNMNVVVVSHSHLPDSYFDKKLEVYKENNFSKLSIASM